MQKTNHAKLALRVLFLYMTAAVVLWLILGWRMAPLDPPPSLLSGVPWGAIGALFAALSTVVVLILTGSFLSPMLTGRSRDVLPMAAFCFLAGAALTGTLSGAVGMFHLGPGLHLMTLLLTAVAFLVFGLHPVMPRFSRPSPMYLVVLPFLLLAGLAALAPMVESDGLRYHVAAPEAWLRANRFIPLPYQVNSNLPALQGLLAAASTGPFELGRVIQFLHFCHFVALVISAAQVGRISYRWYAVKMRLDSSGEDAAALSALLVVGIPAATILASWPFADLASAAYLIGAIWILSPGVIRSALPRLLYGGLFLGAAVAAKISSLPLAAFVALWAWIAHALRGRGWVGSFVYLSILGLIVVWPWIVKNMLYHGNPVYPLAYGMFGGPEWSDANDVFYKSKVASKGLGHGITALLMSPFNMTVNWPAFESFNPGPAIIALLPVAGGACIYGARFFRRVLASPIPALALVAFLGWIVWFKTYQSVRFFIPQLIALILLAAPFLLALACKAGHRIRTEALVVLYGLGLVGAVWTPLYHFRTDHVYRAAVGAVGEDVYIARRFNAYPAIMWLNDNTEKNETVLYIGEHRTAYAENYRPLASDWFDTPLILVELQRHGDNQELFAAWRRRGIRYVLMNLAELRLYEQSDFRPRFTLSEWNRFEALRQELLDRVVFDSGEGVFVADLGNG